ncbi:MAG: protein kinase [Planctomycetes bacterium]|nr:protein kinase [Planctomycetota bacterium]
MVDGELPETKAITMEAPFGDVAVEKGFVTPAQVRECLDLQAQLAKKGVNKRLGDLMVERGYLLPHQVEAVVREQKKAPSQATFLAYEILEKLGEGGMGTVYKAHRRADGGTVALKVLFRRLANDREFLERFRREGEIGRTLDHPNLVQCLEVGEDGGMHYIALEYIDGEDLGVGLQRQGNYPEAQALAIALAAARGIAYAHRRGLVHRDVKPANIMLTREGHVKVMDFGLARQQIDAEDGLTVTGIVMGTPHYIAPEQVTSRRSVDGRSDIYSLGATIFHMLTGRPPFIGGNMYEILSSHVNDRVPDPRMFNRGLSREAAHLVSWMCAREPDKRLATMDKVVEQLRASLGLAGPDPDDARAEPVVVKAANEAGLGTTRANYLAFLEHVRCPRCDAAYEGDPVLLTKDQRLRCGACGLVFMCPEAPPPPPPILPDKIELEEEFDERGVAKKTVVFPKPAPPAPERESDRLIPDIDRPPKSAPGAPLSPAAPAVPGAAARPPGVPPSAAPHPQSLQDPLATRVQQVAIWIVTAAALLGGAAWVVHGLLTGKFDKYF